tara:strand:+ start:1112 stop:1312 length:201 start_codon:yes stop_codon:yes gene_type:complete
MSSTDDRENQLVLRAGASGGKYLQQINKFNLSELSKEEYTNFIKTILAKWAEIKIAEEKLDDEIPF